MVHMFLVLLSMVFLGPKHAVCWRISKLDSLPFDVHVNVHSTCDTCIHALGQWKKHYNDQSIACIVCLFHYTQLYVGVKITAINLAVSSTVIQQITIGDEPKLNERAI